MNRTLLLAASLALGTITCSLARADVLSSTSPAQVDVAQQAPAVPPGAVLKRSTDHAPSDAAAVAPDYSGVALAANDGNLGQYFLMLAFVALMTVLVEIAGRLLPQHTSGRDERVAVSAPPTVQPLP